MAHYFHFSYQNHLITTNIAIATVREEFAFRTNVRSYFSTAKLLSRSQKVSFALLNKIGNARDGTMISQGDRVSLNSLKSIWLLFSISFLPLANYPFEILRPEIMNYYALTLEKTNLGVEINLEQT